MMSSKSFQSLVYPIMGRIHFEIENMQSLPFLRCSDTVKVGKCEWCLEVATECSGLTDNKKYLSVYLSCCSKIEEGKSIEIGRKFSLINQLNPGRHKTRKGESEFTSEYSSCGWANFVEWSELISGGYVKNDKILLECSFRIDSENEIKRGFVEFSEERPNEQDKKVMLTSKNSSKIELFEEEIQVSEIYNRSLFIRGPKMIGLKTYTFIAQTEILNVLLRSIEIETTKQWAGMFFYLESENTSKWWMCDVLVEVRIVNNIDENRSVCKSIVHIYSEKPEVYGFPEIIKWDELVDPSKGYVKEGEFKLQVFFQLQRLYGIDETTDKPINRPTKDMTDIVLVVGEERLNVPKLILAEKSLHFRYLFSSNPEVSELKVENVALENFIRFLELVHNVDTDICEENATGVLETITQFKAPECFEMCDKILRAQEFEDTMQLMEWVDKYPLPGLRRKYLLKLRDETLFKSIFLSDRYKSLSPDMKVAILERKWISEENRMEEVERDDYEFCTDFKKESDLTDVEIEVDGYSYYASKQILANASNYFMKKFYGPHSEDETFIALSNVSSQRFELLITHIYHPTRPVTCSNIDSLLELAQQFSVPRLMDKCEEYLVLKDSIQLIDKFEYAGKYELPYLLESCLKWAKNKEKMKEVKSHHKFPHLEPRVVSELGKREVEQLEMN